MSDTKEFDVGIAWSNDAANPTRNIFDALEEHSRTYQKEIPGKVSLELHPNNFRELIDYLRCLFTWESGAFRGGIKKGSFFFYGIEVTSNGAEEGKGELNFPDGIPTLILKGI